MEEEDSMLRSQGGKSRSSRLLQGLLACAVVQAAAAPALANISLIAPPLVGSGQVSAIAYDQVSNRLYFLDFNGALKSLLLNPLCEAGPPASCASPVPVASFSAPTGLAVNGTTGFAYVTEIDRATSTGVLWRVDLTSGGKVRITALPPGFPHGIVLAPETNSAYIVGQDEKLFGTINGHLWRVDISTGSILSTIDLSVIPEALVVNSARTLAYVLRGNPVRLVTIDLVTGKETRNIGSFGQFTMGPYSLAWTDSSETTLYALIEGNSDSALLRVDPAASTASLVARFATGGNLLLRGVSNDLSSGGLAVNPSGSGVYVGSDHSVVRFPLGAAPNGQVFSSIGYIPRASIPTSGIANTAPGAPFQVVDAPFGGTLDIFGDLTMLATFGATHYRILVSPGPPPFSPGSPIVGSPIVASWTASRWTEPPTGLPHYEPTLVAPDATGLYSIPSEYAAVPSKAPYWSPAYLMMRWPTSDNGLYTLQIQIFKATGTVPNTTPICPSTHCLDITFQKIPKPSDHALTVQVDNTLPVANLKNVVKASGAQVSPCAIVSLPDPNSFTFNVEVSDVNDHLLGYTLGAVWGRNQSATIASDSYPHAVSVKDFLPRPSLSDPHPPWHATCNCAHFFTLTVSKRTTNGYRTILSSSSSQSITINNTGQTCP
jgi:hypothetical protein